MTTVDHSELSYVNKVLQAVGLGEVSTTTQTRTSTQALAVLRREAQDMQAEGWYFNTDYDVEIAPIGSEVAVPADALRIDPMDPSLDLVERNGKMFDKSTGGGTYTITATHKYRVIRNITFSELPADAQDYAAARAAVRLQATLYGDRQQDAILRNEEMRARAKLFHTESRNSEANALQNSFSARRVIGWPFRRNPLLW